MVNFEDENFFFETLVEALNEALAYAKGEQNNCTESIRVDAHIGKEPRRPRVS